MNNDIDQLKSQPSLGQVREILSRNVDNPSFPYTIALIDFTIPEIYTKLPKESKIILLKTFQSLIGIGNLLNRISVIQGVNDKLQLLKQYLEFLQDVFHSEELVVNLVRNAKPIELKEIDKLIFKGKVLSITNEATLISQDEISNVIFESTENFVEYLANSLMLYKSDIPASKIEVFLHSALNFGAGSFGQVCKVFFQKEYWQYFLISFQLMKSFQKRALTKKLFTEFLIHTVNEYNLTGLYNLFLFIFEQIDEPIMESVVQSSSRCLIQLVAALVSNYSNSKLDTLTNKLLAQWSETTYIKNEPISIQESRTFMILQLLLRRKGSAFIKELPKNRVFLDAISNRLLSFSNNVKGLGVVLADYVCELNGEEKIFKLSAEVKVYSSLIKDAFATTRLTEEESWQLLQHCQRQDKPSQISLQVDDLQIDSDDESDDETLPPKANIPDPIYVKDLLEYLTVDTNKPNAYEMRRKALLEGPTLLRQKAENGTEVEFYLEDLLTQLISLDNHFDDKDLHDLQLANIVAVIVVIPKVTLFMYKLLLTGDYSLQQRIMILSASALAARELRGFDDESISKSFRASEFPTKMLPQNLHSKYLLLEGGNKYIDYLLSNLQNQLMEEASNTAQDEILGAGKLVRISARLKRPAKSQDGVPVIKDFYKIIGSNFFFPLVNVWYEAGSIDIGHYSPIFIAHYLRTLNLLLHCAYPSSTQINDMVKEVIVLDCSIIRKISLEEVPIIESIITGLLLVFEISDNEFLILNYNDEIVFIRSWLSISWDRLIDEKLKSLAAGLLLKLQNIATNFERLIMDQDNSIIQI